MKFKFRLTENIYSGKNSNNAINKRKHKKSMSPFVSLNAGDVEKSIGVFNKGFGDDCPSCGESASVGEALYVLNRTQLDEDYLIEDIAAVRRQYSHIPDADFDSIIRLDPTFDENKDSVGKYGKWLLGLYKKDNPLNYPSEEVATLLATYDNLKNNRNYQIEKDINRFKSIDDMQSAVDNVEGVELTSRQKERELRTSKDYKVVYEDEDWTIYIPLSFAGSCTLGKGTGWCTAYSGDEWEYESYMEDGPLYILINKHNKSEKYQFHFETNSFRDKDDRDINVTDFIKKNPGVANFFGSSSTLIYPYSGKVVDNSIPTRILIKDGTKKIREDAFYNFYNVTSVVIPNSVTKIEPGAFVGCESLTSIKLPNSITKIGEHAFEECYSLKSIEIPDSVTEIGESAFLSCNSLVSISIPNKVSVIETFSFSDCTSLQSVVIPSSVTTIKFGAFDNCTSLESIRIPLSVIKIEKSAFRDCTSLRTVQVVKNSYAKRFFKKYYPEVKIEYIPESKNESLKESILPTYTYSYKGPVYRFEKVYTVLAKPVYTTAQNEKQAATMIKGKLKNQFGFDFKAKLDIDNDKVVKVSQQDNESEYYRKQKRIRGKELPDSDIVGTVNGEDIYYIDGYYIVNGIQFVSYEDAVDYLED